MRLSGNDASSIEYFQEIFIMARAPRIDAEMHLQSLIEHYLELVDLRELLPINVKVSSAHENTMVSLFGAPQLPLTTVDQPERASDLTKALKRTSALGPHIVVTGIRPAISSLKNALQHVFASEPNLAQVLGTSGMLNVRYRKPTSGEKSTVISNHAWGTAIDFNIVGHSPPGNTGGRIPRFIALLLPIMNENGWYSGIGFHDTMHFEVSEETIRIWALSGELKP